MNNRDEPRIVRKAWGQEVWLTNGPDYCGKKLTIQPGWRCSMHRHPIKDETFIVESGAGWVMLGDDPVQVRQGAIIEVPTDTWHMFWCPIGETQPLVILEISTHHDDADVVRRSPSARLTVAQRTPGDGA